MSEQDQGEERLPLTVSSHPTTIYADGVGQIMVGGSISKIGLFQQSDPDRAEVTVHIVMPTLFMAEFCRSFLSTLHREQQHTLAKMDEERISIQQILENSPA